MAATRNHKDAYSSLNYYVIMMLQNNKKIKIQFFSHFDTRSAELKRTTTAKRLLFAQDTS